MIWEFDLIRFQSEFSQHWVCGTTVWTLEWDEWAVRWAHFTYAWNIVPTYFTVADGRQFKPRL